MIDPIQSKLQTRKLKMSSRANRFVNYRPRVIRNILLFALRGGNKRPSRMLERVDRAIARPARSRPIGELR